MADWKKTPLYPAHIEAGAKMVGFGGWHMPVQYTGIIEEHENVRKKAGLFDVSHMGEFEVKGPRAQEFLQRMMANDLSKIGPGRILYTPICNEDGGVVDDLLVYCFSPEHYWLVVNASNREKDWQWLNEYLIEQVQLTDISSNIALLALQGPKAQKILTHLTDLNLEDLKSFAFISGKVAGVDVVVSRTGYTGEDGFEIYLPPKDALELWQSLLKGGQEWGLIPVGLGARDTLRLEAGLSLYGHELSEVISPLEAGLGFFVQLNKEESFIGQVSLKRQQKEGINRKLVGLEMLEGGIPRAGYRVVNGREDIGYITSGSYSPSLKKNIALALIASDQEQEDQNLQVIIRNKPCQAKIIKIPFYKRGLKDVSR